MAKILVTGAAGFIGFHTSMRLLARGDQVVGLDNLNDYYDLSLKQLQERANFSFVKMQLADREGMVQLFKEQQFGLC